MRGTIHLRSRPGEGTTIQLSVPLTLAIIDGLLVRLDQDHYVFPLSAARETIELTAHERGLYNGRNLVELRGELLPYLDLRRLFDYPTPPPSVEKVVIVEMEDERLGLVVDEVIGHYQTVLKTLGWLGRQLDVFSGATVLANGHIGLICDLPGLLRLSEAKGVDPATVEALEPALVE
jgi:two-component system, chemotaxis family, sensor kinase CheA